MTMPVGPRPPAWLWAGPASEVEQPGSQTEIRFWITKLATLKKGTDRVCRAESGFAVWCTLMAVWVSERSSVSSTHLSTEKPKSVLDTSTIDSASAWQLHKSSHAVSVSQGTRASSGVRHYRIEPGGRCHQWLHGAMGKRTDMHDLSNLMWART
jgi:hypothetical protein